jgi:phosphodiesterase/alkaline phosphatase D-like protein
MIDRRRFLATLGALAVSPAFPQSGSYPFALGVATGYTLASIVVLW